LGLQVRMNVQRRCVEIRVWVFCFPLLSSNLTYETHPDI
jgi:hypothetical protein